MQHLFKIKPIHKTTRISGRLRSTRPIGYSYHPPTSGFQLSAKGCRDHVPSRVVALRQTPEPAPDPRTPRTDALLVARSRWRAGRQRLDQLDVAKAGGVVERASAATCPPSRRPAAKYCPLPRAPTPRLHDPGLRNPRPQRRIRRCRRPRDRGLPRRAGGAEEVRFRRSARPR